MTRAEALSEVPTLFTAPQIVDALSIWNKPKHVWHALVWIEDQRGKGEFTDEQIAETVAKLEHYVGTVFAQFLEKLRADETWKDPTWPSWRANKNKKEDELHLHDCGVIPPRAMCFPDSEDHPDDSAELIVLNREIMEWCDTPAARAYSRGGFDSKGLQEIAVRTIESCEKEIASAKKVEETRRKLDVEIVKHDANEWLFKRINDRSAMKWAKQFNLPAFGAMCVGYATRKLDPKKFWGEIAKVKSAGELTALEACLRGAAPEHADRVALLASLVAPTKPRADA